MAKKHDSSLNKFVLCPDNKTLLERPSSDKSNEKSPTSTKRDNFKHCKRSHTALALSYGKPFPKKAQATVKSYPTSSLDVVKYIFREGRNSTRVQAKLKWLCSDLCERTKCNNNENVWVGYEKDAPYMPVFVMKLKERNSNIPETFCGFKVVQQIIGRISYEAKYISDIESSRSLIFSTEEHDNIRKCMIKHSKRLMDKHTNLNIVSASKIKSHNYQTREGDVEFTNCIVLYVDYKGIIPFNEDVFPTFLENDDGKQFAVDVREGYFQWDTNSSAPGDYQPRLTIGCKIVNEYGQSGTLGGFVGLPGGKVGALTCWHLFNAIGARKDYQQDVLRHRHLKTDIYQPLVDGRNRFGKLVAAHYNRGDENEIGVDAGLIEITDTNREPQSGSFPKIKTETQLEFNSGDMFTSFNEVGDKCEWTVVKIGAESGMTIGELHVEGTTVRRPVAPKAELHQQLEIRPKNGLFSEPGDSGSLVFMVHNLDSASAMYAVGMHVGSTSHGTAIVTPIWAVLKSLELPLQLLSFEKPRIQHLEREVHTISRKMDEGFKRLERLFQNKK